MRVHRSFAAWSIAVLALTGGPAAAAERCATPDPAREWLAWAGGGDCTLDQTVPGPEWEPDELLRIPVVVHVIMDTPCSQGNLSDAAVTSQIAILNEDFRALPRTNGEKGVDSRIEFFLATVDPQGNPTNGITRHCNSTWYADQGQYWLGLAWNPRRYLNIYTNTANNARGYVPFLPAYPARAVGLPHDRVVLNWLAVGRDGPVPPHDQGRTATHEVGHYLGLYHPYFQGCGVATPPGCYTTGDRICDTPPDAASHQDCPGGATSCGAFPVPIENYMELTDDLCMTGFTAEQVQRMRCTLLTRRSLLVEGALGREVSPPDDRRGGNLPVPAPDTAGETSARTRSGRRTPR